MAINGNNNVNENSEKAKNSNADLKSKFIKDFVNEKLEQNKNDFIDNVMANDSISSIQGLEGELLKFKSSNPIFSDLKLDNINIYDLKVAVGREYLKLENARNNLFGIISKDYEISNNEKILIKSHILTLTDEDINKLIKSKNDTKKLLLNILPNIKKIDKVILINNLAINNSSNRLDLITDKKIKKEIEGILYNISINIVKDSDIRTLFEYDFFTDTEKRELVEIYIPTINLQYALDLGITDKNYATNIKTRILNDRLRLEGLSNTQINSIIDNTTYSDIIVSTEEFFNNSINLNKIINTLGKNVGFSNLELDFEKILKDSQDKLKEKGPSKFEDLKFGISEINDKNRFNNLNKFNVGNIYKIVTKDFSGKDVNSYFKIINIDDNKKELTVNLIGEGNKISIEKFNDNNNENFSSLTYFEFFKYLNDDKNVKLDFFKFEDIERKIADPNNELVSYEYKKLENNEYTINRDSLINLHINGIKNEIEDLEKELDIDKNNQKLKKIIEKKRELLAEFDIYEKDKKIKDLVISNLNTPEEKLLGFINYKRFLDLIDEVDSDGKNIGFEKGIFFEADYGTGNDKKRGIYEITGIDKVNGYVNISSFAGNQKIDFENFYENFKEKKSKRLSRIDNLGEYLLNIQNNNKYPNNAKWLNHEYINGELIAKKVKNGDKESDEKVDYLVSEDNDEILKIINITGNEVEVQLGERKDKKDKGEEFTLDNSTIKFNLNQFDYYIKSHKLYPDWKKGKKLDNPKIKNLQNEFKGSFVTSFFNRVSINELLAGGKILVDGVKETMKKGNDLHAAKFALAIGEYLPGDIGQDMKIKVEKTEAEEMDKELAGLSKVDSPIAVKRIKKWLTNSDTPEYKKEAGVLFMLEKYGHLASKPALYEFRGKRLWYEALGGRVNDELFLEIKKEAEESNITFSEEYLVHILLKRQCMFGYNGIKRRSRLHKDYEGKWKTGINAELEKGYSDASNKRKASDMLKGGNQEASGGTTSNAVGWYKKSIERGGSLEDMSEGFFSLLYSGTLYNIDQATFIKIKTLWDGEGMPMIMARFSSYKSDMELFNKVVLELSKKIEEAYPEFKEKKLTERAQELYNDAKNGNGKESKRFDAASKFWKDFGTPLSRALNISNVSDDKYSKIDKIILLEKDKNPLFREYFKKIRDFSDEIDFKEDLMTDSFKGAGVTGLSPYQVARKTLKMNNSGGFIKDKNAKDCWNELSGDIKSIPSKILINSDRADSKENIEAQRKYLLKTLSEIISGFVENSGGSLKNLSAYNEMTTDIGYDLSRWGIDLSRDFGEKYSASMIMEYTKNPNITRILNGYVDNILSGTNKNGLFYNPIDVIKNHSKIKVDNTLD